MPARGRRWLLVLVGLALAVGFSFPSRAAEPTNTFELFDADAVGVDWLNHYLLAYLSHYVYLDAYDAPDTPDADKTTEAEFLQKFTEKFGPMGLSDIAYFTDHDGNAQSDLTTDTEVVVAENADAIFVVFRGTEGIGLEGLVDWGTNLQFLPADTPVAGLHAGFAAAAQRVYPSVRQRIDAAVGKQVWITGHSLGGALATVTTTLLEYGIGGDPVHVQGLSTYGAPRVMNADAAAAFDALMGSRVQRWVDNEDLVPHVPTPTPFDYTHVGRLNNIVPAGDGACRIDLDDTELGLGLSIEDHAMTRYIGRIGDAMPDGLRFGGKDNQFFPAPPSSETGECSSTVGVRDVLDLVVNPGEPLPIDLEIANSSFLVTLQRLALGLDTGATVTIPDVELGDVSIRDTRFDIDLAGRRMRVVGNATFPMDADSVTVDVTLELGWDDLGTSDPTSIRLVVDGSGNQWTLEQIVHVLEEAFEGAVIDTTSIGDSIRLGSPVLSLEADPERLAFSARGTATLPKRDADGSSGALDAQGMLAWTYDRSTQAGSLVAALRVADPACDGGACIELGSLLPIPGGSLASDVRMPAVGLATILPDGANFDPAALDQEAREFLALVTGTATGQPFNLAGGLQVNADVPLQPLEAVWDALGIQFADLGTAALRLQGSLGFNLSALGSATTPSLESADFTLTGPSMTLAPPDLPDWLAPEMSWPTTGQWEMFLRYAASASGPGTLELGLSLPGITTTLLDDPTTENVVEEASLTVEAILETSPGGTIARLSGSLDTPWRHPFGIEWLTVTDVVLDSSMTVAGGAVDSLIQLAGTVDINGKILDIGLTLDSLEEATLTVALQSEVKLEDVVAALVDPSLVDLPDAVGSAGFGPGSLFVRVTADGVRVDAAVRTFFAPHGENIAASVMFTADFGESVYAVGIRPEPGLMLSDVLGPGVQLPEVTLVENEPPVLLDFELVPQPLDPSNPDSGFAFVFASADLTVPDDDSSPVTSWFAPVFGGHPNNKVVGSGPTVLGAFALPAPLDEFVENLGLRRAVLASGNIPLPGDAGLAFNLKLAVEADPTKLPDLVRQAAGSFELSLIGDAEAGPALKIRTELDLEVLLKQGFDPAVADAMALAGLDAPRAEPLPAPRPADHTCPRGGEIASVQDPDTEQLADYCVDVLNLQGGADISFEAAPPRIVVGLDASLVSEAAQGDPTNARAGWAPFGLDFLTIRSLTGLAEVSFNLTPPSLGIALGVEGNMTLLLPDPDNPAEPTAKNLAGALKAGLDIRPGVPPVAAVVTPSFEGVRVEFPQGVGTADLLQLQDAVSDLAGAPRLQDVVPGIETTIPDLALRNLAFSFSPFGVNELCIPLGIVARGELWLNPTSGSQPGAVPPCDAETFDPAPAPPSSDSCAAKQEDGCVAGMFFSFTPGGIAADGFLAAFDLYPFPMRFENTEVSLRLTLAEQYLKLAGGAYLGPEGETPWAGGELHVQIAPSHLRFLGRIEAFGHRAIAHGQLEPLGDLANPLDLLKGGVNPNLELHLVLADDAAASLGSVPDLGFTQAVLDLADPILTELEEAAAFIDGILGQMTPQTALQTLLALPSRLQQEGVDLGVSLPPWISDLAARLEAFGTKSVEDDGGNSHEFEISEYGAVSLDALLNGVRFPGVRGLVFPKERTCVDLIKSGAALVDALVNETPITEAMIDGLVEGTVTKVEGLDVCWSVAPVLKIVGVPGAFLYPTCFGFRIDGGCWLLPPVEFDLGLCETWFPSAATASSPGGTNCELSEIAAEVEKLLSSAFSEILDLGGVPDLTRVFDAVLTFLQDPDPGALFTLHCAQASLLLSLEDGTVADLAVDATILGRRHPLGLSFDFGDPLASTEKLLADFLGILAGGPGSSSSCGGIPLDEFGPGGIASEPTGSDGDGLIPLALTTTVGPATIVEGSSVTVTGTFNRPVDVTDGVTAMMVAWGDGSATTVPVVPGDTSFTTAHAYPDDGPSGTSSHTYKVTVSGGDGLSSTLRATVRNDPPRNVIATLDHASIDEGDTATLTVTFDDVGVEDTHAVTILWGDGNSTFVPSATSGLVRTHTYRDDNPTGGPGPDAARINVVVSDDDAGRGVGATVVDVSNVAPTAASLSLSPTAVDEGQAVQFTINFDDVGVDDSHSIEIDWDDGTQTSVDVPLGQQSVDVLHTFADDDPTGTPQDVHAVAITITDDDAGVTTVWRDLTVRNVAPTVCLTVDPGGFAEGDLATGTCPEHAPLVIDEGGDVELTAAFHDPGWLDTHTATIDWGDPALANSPVTVASGARGVNVSQAFGDNGDFTLTITVEDDDGGRTSKSVAVTVKNVDPTVTIRKLPASLDDQWGTIMADGPDDNGVLETPTFLRRAGVSGPFRAWVTDPGSDDITSLWDWDVPNRFDPATTSSLSRVNPPIPDPFPSPTLQPRAFTTEASHAWSQPCLYQLRITASDDDAGMSSDEAWVVVTGTDHRLRRPGWWFNQYDSMKSNRNSVPEPTLACHLESTRHLSAVFGTFRELDTFRDARDVLNTKKSSRANEIMVRQLLASWLNLLHGSVGWFDTVDTDGDGLDDARFHEVLRHAETVRLDPASTREELLAQEEVLEYVNGGQ